MTEQPFATAHATRYHIGNPPLAMKTTLRALKNLGEVPVFEDNSAFKTWIKSNAGRGLAGDRGKADDASRAYMNLGVALELDDGRIVIDLSRLEQLIDHVKGEAAWSHHSRKSAARRARRLLTDLEESQKPKVAITASVVEERAQPVAAPTAAGKVESTVTSPAREILASIASYQEAAAAHGKAVEDARRELDGLEKKLLEMGDSEGMLSEKLQSATADAKCARDLCVAFVAQCSEAAATVAALERQLQEAREQATSHNAELQRVREQLEDASRRRDTADQLIEQIRREGETVFVAYEEASRRLAELEENPPIGAEKLEQAAALLEQLNALLNG